MLVPYATVNTLKYNYTKNCFHGNQRWVCDGLYKKCFIVRGQSLSNVRDQSLSAQI